jgi:hypothetical protein
MLLVRFFAKNATICFIDLIFTHFYTQATGLSMSYN